MYFAFALNLYGIFYSPEVYENTFVTKLLYKILTNPYPYWGIIFLCGLGTFLSIYFGDEMMDVFKHKNREKFHAHGFKLQILAVAAFFVLIVIAYYHLLETLGLKVHF